MTSENGGGGSARSYVTICCAISDQRFLVTGSTGEPGVTTASHLPCTKYTVIRCRLPLCMAVPFCFHAIYRSLLQEYVTSPNVGTKAPSRPV